MEIYIKGTGVISPQETFHSGNFPDKIIEYRGARYLQCMEPAFREYIDPMAGRRMSRIVKMGVCAAKKCMQDAGISMPDAIITGTGLGCLEDTEKFLSAMIGNEEKLLNPTPFIQSTHNTVSSAIALAIKCHNYNSTYVHRGFSFENALQDAILYLNENPGTNVLVGGLDEITESAYKITDRLGMWKKNPVDHLSLVNYHDEGSIPGEGVSFFMLGNGKDENTSAKIQAVGIQYKPESKESIERKLKRFLADSGIDKAQLDLVIMGFNGDRGKDYIFYDLQNEFFKDLPVAYYKHLCGEYDTSVSFAMWLSTAIIKQQKIPDVVKIRPFEKEKINDILIFNHVHGINHSMILVRKC